MKNLSQLGDFSILVSDFSYLAQIFHIWLRFFVSGSDFWSTHKSGVYYITDFALGQYNHIWLTVFEDMSHWLMLHIFRGI